jgi:hypothetical protein
MADDDADPDDPGVSLFYKLILKLPQLSLEGFSDRFQGLFWILILPILVMSDSMITLLLIVCLPFPFSLISTVVVTSIVLIFMIRILLERELNARRAIIREGRFLWNVEKAVNEYERLLQKRKSGKETKKRP